jgi:hypothetical protein
MSSPSPLSLPELDLKAEVTRDDWRQALNSSRTVSKSSQNGQAMPAKTEFHLEADAKAREWLLQHPSGAPLVIAYDVHRCCGGGKICQVNVRGLLDRDNPDEFASGFLNDGTRFLIDRRAAARLPVRFGLTVRGLGPLKHLDLDLAGEEWGTLLYD